MTVVKGPPPSPLEEEDDDLCQCGRYGDHLLGCPAADPDPWQQDDACHECPPSEFEWSDTMWVDGAPVMVCREHGHRAPGHVYDLIP